MQFLLLVLATTLVAVSVVLATVCVDRRERERKRLEARLASGQQQLQASWEMEHAAQQKISTGETLLGLLRLGLMPKRMHDLVVPRVAHWVHTALADRHSASTGETWVSPEQLSKWTKLKAKAEKDDIGALDELIKLFNDYQSQGVQLVKTLEAEIDALGKQCRNIETSIAKTRYVAVALQILGLIVVLARDLVS